MPLDTSRNCLTNYALQRKSEGTIMGGRVDFSQYLNALPKDILTNAAPTISTITPTVISESTTVLVQNVVISTAGTACTYQIAGGATGEVATVILALALSDGATDKFWYPVLID